MRAKGLLVSVLQKSYKLTCLELVKAKAFDDERAKVRRSALKILISILRVVAKTTHIRDISSKAL
jgi:hypothetical protein